MNNISHSRHSLAHLLGAAILKHYPQAHLTIGPATETGFYYDAELPTSITEDELAKLESTMRELVSTWDGFICAEISPDEARALFANNPYKLELIEEIVASGEPITTYTSGQFVDLCKGGHVDSMRTIPENSWKLDRIAGAYWRGDAERTMLTRIYGLAFENKEALDYYLWQLEEGKKRDHRKLGKELKLFLISDLVGSGLPLWLPAGNILRQEVISYLWELHRVRGYHWVTTPHLAKESLYEVSGHAGHYLEDMFSVHGGTSKEQFFLKPMNCPHHMELYKSEPRSYRDMPIRYFEPAFVYRDEKTGQLAGLTRVRSITQDDGHLYCRMSQVHEEACTIVGIIKEFYQTLGMMDGYRVRLSMRGDDHSNFIGSDEQWNLAEDSLRAVCESEGLPYYDGPGEAAFYGPKLDFMFQDAIGREHQLGTIQCDFNAPNRFDLTFTNEEGVAERPVVIHRAISGSIERFLGVAIEHFAGSFPVWLSPTQVAVLPISDEKHGEYAREVYHTLLAANIRCVVLSGDTLGKRIREAKTQKIPYQIVVGDAEVTSGVLTIEGRNSSKLSLSLEAFIAQIMGEINSRAL